MSRVKSSRRRHRLGCSYRSRSHRLSISPTRARCVDSSLGVSNLWKDCSSDRLPTQYITSLIARCFFLYGVRARLNTYWGIMRRGANTSFVRHRSPRGASRVSRVSSSCANVGGVQERRRRRRPSRTSRKRGEETKGKSLCLPKGANASSRIESIVMSTTVVRVKRKRDRASME